MKHAITSLSNASLDTHPGNTLTKFTHVLPKVIPLGKPHCIALKKIVLSHALKTGSRRVGFIKIHLSQLNSQNYISGAQGDHSRCLAQIQYPQEIGSHESTFSHIVDNPLFIDIPHLGSLTQLSFLITDEHDKQLALERGVATLIETEVQEMEWKSQFNLVINANDSKHLFANNTQSSFNTAFTSPIQLKGEWEVALHSVIVPKGLTVGDFEVLLVQDGLPKKQWSKDHRKDNPSKDDFVKTLKSWGIDLFPVRGGALWVRIGDVEKVKPGSYVAFNRQVLSLFGVTSKSLWVRRYLSDRFVPLGTMDGDEESSEVEHVLMYCDIVEHSIIGNVLSPYLGVLSSTSAGLLQHDIDTYYPIKHLDYNHG